MKNYQEQRQANIDLIARQAPAIAKAMGAEWWFYHDDAGQSEYFFKLQRTDGVEINARKKDDNGRFSFSGEGVSIGVDLRREPKAIAADIKRRLLPDVIRLKKEHFVNKTTDEQKTQRYQAYVYGLAADIGATVHKDHHDELTVDVGRYPASNCLSIKVTKYQSNGHFDTTLSISRATPDLARLIGQMVTADHKQRQPA
jgi:hypothetical protein